MTTENKQRPRQHSFSINPTTNSAPPSTDPLALLQNANSLIVASLLLLLVGVAPFLIRTDFQDGYTSPIYLRFPYNCIFFLPLLIPLSTYLVIARWTGEKHYRHS